MRLKGCATRSGFWELEVDFHWLSIIYAEDIEAEEIAEFALVAGEVG
jgi:hypothetical protein